jgi:hypothetical protein
MAMAELAGRVPLTTVFLVALIGAALLLGPAAASSAPLPVPGAFRLAGSNGYTIYVLASPPRAGRAGRVQIYASAKDRGASYSAPATVTETSIQANLGDLGEIAVTFQRSNQARSVPCGRQTIRFDSGNYEGTIDFRGEEGYTSVEATSAPGIFTGFCGEGFIEGGPPERARGAALYVRNPALGPELSVHKSRPGAAAQIAASTSEYSNGISIDRYEWLQMPGSDFTFDRHLRTAAVHPPAPFSGSAQFDLRKKAGRRWSGDLSVDLPGRSGVPLTGPTLRATLIPSE